jgi:hypothetical protein
MSDDSPSEASKAPPPVAEHVDTITLGLELVWRYRGPTAAADDATNLIGVALRFVFQNIGPRACLQLIAEAEEAALAEIARAGGSPTGQLH